MAFNCSSRPLAAFPFLCISLTLYFPLVHLAQLKGLGVFNPSSGMEEWGGPPKSSCMRRFEGPNGLPNGMASGGEGTDRGGSKGEGGVFPLSVKLIAVFFRDKIFNILIKIFKTVACFSPVCCRC